MVHKRGEIDNEMIIINRTRDKVRTIQVNWSVAMRKSSISTYDGRNSILKNVTLDPYVGVSQAKINKYRIRNEKEKLLILSS